MTGGDRISRSGMLRLLDLNDGGGAQVQFRDLAVACGGCAARCQTGAGASHLRLSRQDLQATSLQQDGLDARAGQAVTVSVLGRGLNTAALALFGLPVALLLVGALVGEHMAAGVGSVVLGYCGFAVACAVLATVATRLLGGLQLRVEPVVQSVSLDHDHGAAPSMKDTVS